MKKIDACKLKRKGGFTLVELIVVLVLLSVLSAVAVPTYLGYVDDNKAKQCERNRQALASYLDNMLVTNPGAGMSDVIAAHSEIECPSGGEYKVLDDSVNNTVYCTCEGHGGTEGAVTVIARKGSQVTAKSSTEREKEVEKKPEPTDPPKEDNSPEEPTLTLSLDGSSAVETKTESMFVGTEKMLNVYPTASNCQEGVNYTWQESGGAAQIESGSGTATVTIKAISAGSSTFTCQATAVSAADNETTVESNTISVTVNVAVEPSLTISIDPASANLAPNASRTLTVKAINMEGCTSIDSYQWDVTPKGVVALEGSSDETVSIKATGSGFCTVTCKATATRDDGKGLVDSNEAKTSINVSNVSFSLPDEIMIPVWQSGGGYVNSKLFEELKNYGYDVPQGGWWSCPDPRVTEGKDWNYVTYDESTGQYINDGGYIEIDDKDEADDYELTYTYYGKSATMTCHVVYPIYELYSSGKTGQKFSMELGDECELETLYHWENTTDGPMEWSCDNDKVINYSIIGGAKNNKVKVKATSVGTAELTASMLCHYNQAIGKTPLYQTYPWTITVNYRTITGVTAEKLVLVEGGEPQQIQFTPIPSEGTDPSVTYKYNGNKTQNDDFLTITEGGLVTPKKACKANVYFDAYLDGKVICGGISCEVEIKTDSSKVEIQGKKFNAASWENLQEYLVGGRTDESFNRGGVYVRTYEQWGAEQKELLVINPNANFEWKEEYGNMTFEEFLNEPGIREKLFVPLNSNCIDLLADNVWYWAGLGSIAKRGEDLYVCIKQVDKGNVSEWPDGYLEEYFVKIA